MSSDSIFCTPHRTRASLIDLVDTSWALATLPDDDIPLPPELIIDPDSDKPKVDEVETWTDLGLNDFAD